MRGYLARQSRRGSILGLLAALALIEVGCASAQKQMLAPPTSSGIEQIREVDLRPRAPQNVHEPDTLFGGPQPQTYFGQTESPDDKAKRKRDAERRTVNSDDHVVTGSIPAGVNNDAAQKGFEMNFENAPVATVAKAILGDILGVGYTVDPRVLAGTVSLSSGRPVQKKDLLYVLESALRANNIALVREREGYRLVPAAEATGTGAVDTDEAPRAGYGITVIPLEYVSAQALSKLLDSFGTKSGAVRADVSRNLILVQGNGSDRRAAIDTVLSFDVDWMRGQSVGVYPVSNSTPEPVIAELDKIIDAGEGGLNQNLVKLQPIARENAILVVTRRPELLKTVSTWISRLDRAGVAGTGVKVYRMRYGDAHQVAALLNEMFVGGSGNLDNPMNQLTPGNGAVATRSAPLNVTQQLGMNPQQPSTNTAATLASTSNSPPTVANAGVHRDAEPNTTTLGGGAALLPGVRITADRVNNAVLVYASEENYRIIARTLEQLDRPQLQVAIDSTIAEVTLNDQLTYGVQFFLQSNSLGMAPNKGSIINSIGEAVLAQQLPGFNFLAGSAGTPNLILNALHTVTDVKVLSNPSLVVLNNQPATLQVGDQVPVSTGTATVLTSNNTIVNTIDYRNTGIILSIIPRVNQNGNVVLDIEQEISSVEPTSTANTLTPTVSQRRIKSSIAVQSGQTVLLAGLISDTENLTKNGVPLLDELPKVGDFFAQKNKTVARTELIVFIRPQIIRNGFDARHVAEQLRSKMDNIFGVPPPPPAPRPGPLKAPPPHARAERSQQVAATPAEQ